MASNSGTDPREPRHEVIAVLVSKDIDDGQTAIIFPTKSGQEKNVTIFFSPDDQLVIEEGAPQLVDPNGTIQKA